ncbi:hypothetical protein HPO96_29260 [Kribbella sandramycini]|uniref:Uncharacterized protein n=1 Tax=Kribbella sandramycini TaxID=60450 RepID=A0A7Y4P3N5_9ACTN|nr:hypothetical protein [Kribbella sandramycini]MBB6571699.1 hypothetical protein [Kribbella sandramycini]NOL44344.1 hypothetical protein [Kribbella sandramycini]
MAELDYAFVADYAKVERSGTLTVVGASYTQVTVSRLPAAHLMSIAGRVRSRVDAGPVSLTVTIKPPLTDQFVVVFTMDLTPEPDARPYGDGRLGLLFAITTGLPLDHEGVYTIDLELEGSHARTLMFEVIKS